MGEILELENNESTEKGLEEMFTELDGLVAQMQGKEMTLEETFASYKRGLELVEKCSNKIEKIQCDIKLLNPEEEI